MRLSFKAIIIIAVVCPLLLHAQSNYKQGYVVNGRGDTLRGYIDYRGWEENPANIDFKPTLADKQIQKLTADNINAFAVSGLESYQKYTGPVSMDATDVNHINTARDTSFKTASVFLKVLEKGERVSLYQYTDDLKTRFFIRDGDGDITELIYRVYYTTENPANGNGNRMVTENAYFRQLYIIADKYHLLDNSLHTDIERSDYYKQNLIKIITRINGISKPEYEKKYNEATKLNLYVCAGLNIASIKPYGNYADGKSAISYFPLASFAMGIYANPTTQKLEFLLAGTISGDSYRSIYLYTGSPYVPVRYYYSQLWFALTPQFTYSFYNSQNLKIFAGAGLAFTFRDYYHARGDLSYADTQVAGAALPTVDFFNTFSLPVVIKAGAKIGRKAEVFAAYYLPYQVTQDHYFQLNTSDIQLGLSYKFK